MVRNGVYVYFSYSGQHACGSLFPLLMFSRKLCIGKKNSPPVVNFYSLLQRLKPEGNPKVNRNHTCMFHDLNWDCLSQRKSNTYMCNLIRPPSASNPKCFYSLVPRSTPFSILWFVLLIIHESGRTAKWGRPGRNHYVSRRRRGSPAESQYKHT